MKIILSPSKTQDLRDVTDLENIDKEWLEALTIQYGEDRLLKKQKTITRKLVKELKAHHKSVIASKMKLRGKLLDQVMAYYKNFNKRISDQGHCAYSYTGTVFKELDFQAYSREAFEYMNEHLVVMSALYGPIPAFYKIRNYRLDMTMALFEESLYRTWKPIYAERFNKEDLIIDLGSKEFSKQIKAQDIEGRLISFEFLQPVKGAYKAIAYHSKQARGLMANFMIKNQVTNLEDLKIFNALDYKFAEDLSTKDHYVYKKIK